MIHKNMVLQDDMKAEEDVLRAYGEAYPAYHDAKQAMNIKEEELSDIEVEEGTVPITFPEIKAKPEVSCMSLFVHC
jgi:hypothetical protein